VQEQEEIAADEPETEEQTAKAESTEDVEEEAEAAAASATMDTLHFEKDTAIWPIEGEILLDYSMDVSTYFPTLEQYRYNPAMVIAGAVNDKVYATARGTITQIAESEETGCTVTQDLGDGYTAIYGQLKELNFAEGDTVEAGQVLGYVSEPTKYYSVEGSNVYFSLQKDGEAVDPKEYLPEMPMDTLD
jgi:murein DD-endopeptidase MepM/ murein hydrolase activator NlpD